MKPVDVDVIVRCRHNALIAMRDCDQYLIDRVLKQIQFPIFDRIRQTGLLSRGKIK